MAPIVVDQSRWLEILTGCPAGKITRTACLKLYTLQTINAHVSVSDVQDKVECYNYMNKAGRSEFYYILNDEKGERAAVRGVTNARFVYFHNYMTGVAKRHQCSFDDSYFANSGERIPLVHAKHHSAINGKQAVWPFLPVCEKM